MLTDVFAALRCYRLSRRVRSRSSAGSSPRCWIGGQGTGSRREHRRSSRPASASARCGTARIRRTIDTRPSAWSPSWRVPMRASEVPRITLLTWRPHDRGGIAYPVSRGQGIPVVRASSKRTVALRFSRLTSVLATPATCSNAFFTVMGQGAIHVRHRQRDGLAVTRRDRTSRRRWQTRQCSLHGVVPQQNQGAMWGKPSDRHERGDQPEQRLCRSSSPAATHRLRPVDMSLRAPDAAPREEQGHQRRADEDRPKRFEHRQVGDPRAGESERDQHPARGNRWKQGSQPARPRTATTLLRFLIEYPSDQ